MRLVVIRLGPGGDWLQSKPCAGCLEALQRFGIRSVSWSGDDGALVTQKPREVRDPIARGRDQYPHGTRSSRSGSAVRPSCHPGSS